MVAVLSGSIPLPVASGSAVIEPTVAEMQHSTAVLRVETSSGSAAAQALSSLQSLGVLLVLVPVFIQAPWVRNAPMAAALFTGLLLATGIVLERHPQRSWSERGALLVGFSGSWLAGSLFWGWCRLHPLWHLPIEAFALPLALGGLQGRWRLAASFYLASLLGTAATDAAMAISGVMPLWPTILAAPLSEAPVLLQAAALAVMQPVPLVVIGLSALLLVLLSRRLRRSGPAGALAAATLGATLAVDGLFLLAALLAPSLTGLL